MAAYINDDDTIAALSTPPGRGAIGVIRISGDEAVKVVAALFRGSRDPLDMPSGQVSHGWIEWEGRRLDEVLLLVMRAPRTFTGQDLVEIHCHGGPVVVQSVLEAVIEQGVRPALPGEFTRRAFLSGRIDLAQAEAVADLIDSRTRAAARFSASQLAGELSRVLQAMSGRLAELLALVEAGIDFADEEDVRGIEPDDLDRALQALARDLERAVQDAGRGRLLREGSRVVIAGKPNVGKSTLMNALLQADRVIVTPEPGTTRDLVEDFLDLGGIPIRLFDTAGIRASEDRAEDMGVGKARSALESADLAVFMVDGSRPLTEEDTQAAEAVNVPALIALNKSDLPAAITAEEAAILLPGAKVLSLSALKGDGLEELRQKLVEMTAGGEELESAAVTSARHQDALRRAAGSVVRARLAVVEGMSDEFAASDMRRALDALGEITGETASEDILDAIFSRFCIGK